MRAAAQTVTAREASCDFVFAEFIGDVVVGLATDPSVAEYSGKAVVAAQLAQTYGIRDLDGKKPRPLTLQDV